MNLCKCLGNGGGREGVKPIKRFFCLRDLKSFAINATAIILFVEVLFTSHLATDFVAFAFFEVCWKPFCVICFKRKTDFVEPLGVFVGAY